MADELESMRINRFLALCGVGSRRACEALVEEGRVSINGEISRELNQKVVPGDAVLLNGKKIEPQQETTIVLHKPRGLICTRNDEKSRHTIYTLLPKHLHNLRHVGRLDRDSEGLLILSNSGELSNQLTHPGHSVEKEYRVTLDQSFPSELVEKLLSGIYTEDGTARAARVRLVSARRLEVTLTQGMKRQIRVMFQTLGFRVKKLVRFRIGKFVEDIPAEGQWRVLKHHEIADLLENPKAPRQRDYRSTDKSSRRRPPEARKFGRRTAAKTTARKGVARKTPSRGGPPGRPGRSPSRPGRGAPGRPRRGGPGRGPRRPARKRPGSR